MIKFNVNGGSKRVYNKTADMLSAVVNHMIDKESEITDIEIFNIGSQLHIKCRNENDVIRFVGMLNTDINEHNFVRDKLTVMYNNCRDYKKYDTETDVRIGNYKDNTHYEYYYNNLHDSILVWNQILVDLVDLIDVLSFMAVI